MKNKILIIGQAPPAVKQTYPYDTTLLYDILEWVGINKKEAQGLFEFDALVDKFPGYSFGGGHLKPGLTDIKEYYNRSLKDKIDRAGKIILLGNEARNFIKPNAIEYGRHGKYLFLPHPSKRNYDLIMKNRLYFTMLLKTFID